MKLISIRLLKNARDDIISTERCKRGHISLITHLARRPEGAGAIYVQA